MIKPIAVSLAMILGTNAQAMSKEQPAVDTLPLSECFIENVKTKALCGTLDVPENRQLPLSENNKIELNLVVLPKFKEESKKLPVMFLAGGPGQAATELAGMLNGPLHSVRQESDIILVDQRGTGKSSALKCDKELIDSLSYDDSKLDFQQETNDCLSQLTDKHLPSYNTYDSIEDFEAVREALGHKQVHIIGGSYGTRAGFAYLKQHPESVKTAILDSNAPMELVIGMFGKTSERAFDLLIEDCQAHQACAEAFPELKQDLLALMTRLKQEGSRGVSEQ